MSVPVYYVCSCGSDWPLLRLYFCSHCSDIRCLRCLIHEADIFYCPSCLEPQPASDARSHGCLCTKCTLCPICRTQLAIKAAMLPDQDQASAGVTQPSTTRAYYLHCSVCHWSSREAGLPDQEQIPSASQFFEAQEPSQSDVTWINQLNEAYRQVLIVEKAVSLSKKKKTGRRGSHFRKMTQVTDKDVSLALELVPKAPAVIPEDEPTDAVIFGPNFGLNGLLLPTPRQLAVRRLLRCQKCDHVVSLPDMRHGQHSNKAWFRMSLGAASVLPNIRLFKASPDTFRLSLSHPAFGSSAVSAPSAESLNQQQPIRVHIDGLPDGTSLSDADQILVYPPSESDELSTCDNRLGLADDHSVNVKLTFHPDGSDKFAFHVRCEPGLSFSAIAYLSPTVPFI